MGCSPAFAIAPAVPVHLLARAPSSPPRSHPSGDTELVASMEQAVPVQPDWLNFNRFTLRAEKTLPIGPLRCVALHVAAPAQRGALLRLQGRGCGPGLDCWPPAGRCLPAGT